MDVGLALRAQRRELRMSQRGFAHDVSLSASQVARLEARPDSCSLDLVLRALEATAWALALNDRRVVSAAEVSRWFAHARLANGWSIRLAARRWDVTTSMAHRLCTDAGALKLGLVHVAATEALRLVHRGTGIDPDWTVPEQDARVLGGRRRYAGHHHVIASPTPPDRWNPSPWRTFSSIDDLEWHLLRRRRIEQCIRDRDARIAALPPLPPRQCVDLNDVQNWDDFDDWDEEDCGIDQPAGGYAEDALGPNSEWPNSES